MWLQEAPLAALGPLMGFLAADIAVDIMRGRLGSVGIEIVIAPLLAVSISLVAQRAQPGISGMLMLVLGGISALGASALLALALTRGVAPLAIIGLRHLVVAAYAWAAIAEEPPPRRRLALRPIQV